MNWAKTHLMPTKYGNFYDPIEGLETRPEKTQQGYWRLEGRNDEWLDEIERPERTLEVRAQAKA